MTLLRYARSTYAAETGGADKNPSRSGLTRSQRRKRPSRSALKRSVQQRHELDREHLTRSEHRADKRWAEEQHRKERPSDFHTTIIDPPRPSRASYAVLTAMLLGGACGLGVGFLRSSETSSASMASAEATERGQLEVLPALKAGSASEKTPKARASRTSTRSAKRSQRASAKTASATLPVPAKEPEREVVTDRLRERESLSLALSRHGVGIEEINALVDALRGKVDLRGMRAGDVFRLESREVTAAAVGQASSAMALNAFEYRPRRAAGAPVKWRVERNKDRWQVEKVVTPVTTKIVPLAGEVHSSLYVAMRALGEGSALVSRFVDVFAWDIDFYRQPQKGDTFKVLVEKQFADGRFVGYGKVLAAEYVNAGDVHRGFAFSSSDDKVAGYFDENGRAREKTFLKNPLEIALITSSYGQRFHPILRRQKAHNGVDYGAGSGTPFWAVADGVVQEARYSKTAGNFVVIRHINGYETEYFHASRFAEGIRAGARVKQRQVIGYVGSTGRSTGPHLHFGMRKRGSYVDPGKQVFPAAEPVPKKYLKEFKDQVGPLLAELEALENV